MIQIQILDFELNFHSHAEEKNSNQTLAELTGFQTRPFKIVLTSGIRLMCRFENVKLFPNSKPNSLI